MSTKIASDGTITVDGKIVTPAEASKLIPTVEHEVWNVITAIRNRKNWSIKNGEKVLLWGAGLISATNGFAQLSIPSNVRGWIIGGAAFVLGAIHNSTPVK